MQGQLFSHKARRSQLALTLRAMASAVRGWSPVTMATLMPALRHLQSNNRNTSGNHLSAITSHHSQHLPELNASNLSKASCFAR
jgi:hypothetical protein